MADDSKTQLARRATVLGQISRLDLPQFPSLPQSFIQRFPELKQYEEDKKRWSDRVNQALSKLSTLQS